MFDANDDLLAKIRLGEDSVLELKAVRFRGDRMDAPSREDLADELAAFANSRDGVLVLGVDDKTREIVGVPLERLDAVESFAREVCNDTIVPPLNASIIRMELPDPAGNPRAVVKIDVPRSLFVHRGPSGYFHRIGSSKREMSPELLARLFQQRSQTRLIRFDEQVIAGARISDLDPALCERFRGARSRDGLEDLLHKLAMARPDGDNLWRPTVAGVLLGSREPRRWLPNAYIQAVAYRGTGVVPEGDGADTYQIDAKDLDGPLDQQIIDACQFVFRNMAVEAFKHIGRVDRPQYDMASVFEAIVNAAAHRDYSIYGSKIRLRMFRDRLELSSPGSLPNTMSIDSLPYRQAARNEVVASLLARCPVPSDARAIETERSTMMDRRGEGVSIILDRSTRHAGVSPVYRTIDDSELVLTIYAPR